jgi:hypothetical protein
MTSLPSRQQQPAAQLLVYGMMAITHGGLGHLGDQALGVAKQDVKERLMMLEFGFEASAGEAIR